MYAKLAWRNIRRSLRDYGIYFLTLVFAVAIFYVFNTLADQPAFLALRESTRLMAQGAVEMMGWLSAIMTGVVGLLVFYANRAIIKKRSRELGTYLLLGMEQGRLALLLLVEVTLVGMAALLVGLLAGLFLSQFFALVVNWILAAGLTGHPFIISPAAIARTLLYYGLAFLLVALWQAMALYRQKLIDLISSSRKQETIRLRSRSISLVIGCMSLLALCGSYWLADQTSRKVIFEPTNPRNLLIALLGVVGTYLLFASLAGLLTGVRRRSEGWLARGLNLFLYRQVTSKINTHAALLSTITVMLTITICAMSAGLGLGQGVAQRADEEVPFDYLFFSTSATETFQPILSLFDKYGVTKRQMVQFVSAASDLRDKDLMLPDDAAWFVGRGPGEFVAEAGVRIISLTAYRELRKLKGYTDVTLPRDRFLIHASAVRTKPGQRAHTAYLRFLESGSPLTLAGHTLRPSSAQLYAEPLGSQLAGTTALLVVPDEVARTLPEGERYLALQVKGRVPEALDRESRSMVQSARDSGNDMMWVEIRAEALSNALVVEGTLVFLSFYIGVMFILISATLLALQQVTDAVEHRQRFEVLRKLGVDEPMIDRTIARQLGLYFLTPVAVALVHSLVAMFALARLFLLGAGYTTVWPATLVTLGIFVLIYGTYYLLSLQSCRALFKAAQPQ